MPQQDQQQQQTPYIAQLAQQAGTTATQGLLGGIFGQIFAKSNDRRQLRQQEKLQNLQIRGQEQLTDYNYAKQLQMWKDTSYGAQMEQLQKAGLNPGLLYGIGGGGGQSNNIQQGQVSAGHAEQNPGEVQQFAGMALQNGLMMSQMKLMQAQARNLDADTQNKPLQGEQIQAQTGLIQANTGNVQIDTAMKQIELAFNKETYNERVDTIIANTQQAQETTMQQAVETNIKRATEQDIINTIHTNAIGALLVNALTKEQTKVQTSEIAKNAATVNKMAQDVAQGWQSLDNQAKIMKVNAIMQSVDQLYRGTLGKWLRSHDPYEISEQIDKVMGTNTVPAVNKGILHK